MPPYFSILVPSYNRPEYVTQCLDSIIGGGFDDYEVIVSDDNSPRAGEVESAVAPYTGRANVRFFRQSSNLREPGNKNFLVSQASGRFNIVIGDDDQLYPGALSRIKECIERNPGYDLYGLGYSVIDENGAYCYSRRAPRGIEISDANPVCVRHVLFSDLFPFWLYHAATFCSRNGLEREIPYSREAGIGEDLLFLFDFVNKGKRMFVIPEVAFMWRRFLHAGPKVQHNQSLTGLNGARARRNILYHLDQRTDLRPEIKSVLRGLEFRRRFLYSPILRDCGADPRAIESLELSPENSRELAEWRRDVGRFGLRVWPYLRRCADFVSLFGIRGLVEIAKVFIERLTYKMRYGTT